jgi:glycosyltransferase involved in cell wall biosynthesis
LFVENDFLMEDIMSQHPKVSIGLPVYNGENYLEEALDSILSQTFSDFELIISDNASTDRTQAICLAYRSMDPRIRYYRITTNIGGADNARLTFELSKGKYFRWAGHDDICAPELLEKCVAVLDADPSIVLCFPLTVKIDANGDIIETVPLRSDYSLPTPNERFRFLTSLEHGCEAAYGLMPAHILRLTGLERNYSDSDRTLLSHMGLLGQFYQIPEPLFYKRIHPQKSTKIYPNWRDRMAWYRGADDPERITFPYWLQFFHYLEIIHKTPIPYRERILCYAHMSHWLVTKRRWGKLINDLIIAGRKKVGHL